NLAVIPRGCAAMKLLLVMVLGTVFLSGISQASVSEAERWHREAQRVEIVRDQWGIAHIYGKSDADTVFGTIYAQAEDDFRRVEHNYLTGLGLLAQAEGESKIYADLRQRLFVDPEELQKLYVGSPAWLKT